ncbi:calexcitin-2 [Osmia bicornis bicornis]|uniref:calexcitin-2 n=1 Tax=Osmia bicornis bicornis TaxID=1437191 RepID=UPI0010F53AEA|nr:calexcitin-2 [Osmia bicornis bicornis]XP_029047321.1 calexcitin-2 [Osmia bicornis bicornis]
MSLSEFRKKKLLYVFNTFFDVNQSGTIDRKDFDLAIQRINENRGWSADNPKALSIKENLLKMWEGLRSRADTDQDGQVSRDEWFSLWEEYAKNPSNPSEWQQTYMTLTFQLFDASGDKSIDENEFCNVCRYHGVAETEARDAFKKLGVGQEMNWDKFTNLWKQYFSSDEPTAAGNFIFGKTSF